MKSKQHGEGHSATLAAAPSDWSAGLFGPQTRSSASISARWILGLTLLLLLLSGATAFLASHHENALKARDDARRQIMADVGPNLVAALSYDYRHMDQDLSRALSGLTPGFGADYRRLFQTTLIPTATKYRGVVTAEVVAAGLESLGGTNAEVIAFIDQTTATRVLPAPRVDSSRVRVRVLWVAGKWRIAEIDPF